jgi:hypothetical protein
MSTLPARSAELRHSDRLGMLASGLCVAHCLALTLLPALAVGVEAPGHAAGTLEWILVLVAVAVAGVAARSGHRLHGSWWVTGGFLVGVAALLTGRLGEAFHLVPGATAWSVGGGLALVAAHLASLRRCQHCREG